MANCSLETSLEVFILGVAVGSRPVSHGHTTLDVVLHGNVVLAGSDPARHAALPEVLPRVAMGFMTAIPCGAPEVVSDADVASAALALGHFIIWNCAASFDVVRSDYVEAPMADAALQTVLQVVVLGMPVRTGGIAFAHSAPNVILTEMMALTMPDTARQAAALGAIVPVVAMRPDPITHSRAPENVIAAA
mmetsp:Transcript_77922/g.167188  ORF Transcript_77922/g.167188 Transcript_77922/m.167188 type:complete len:191 (+) Transcript_77922:368-940(+)